MKDTNKIFFGAEGLTQTSANYTANLAKEKVKAMQTKLGGLVLCDTYVQLIGSHDSTQCVVGTTIDELEEIPAMLDKIAKHHELIAWLREAIKAKEYESTDANKYGIDDYAKEQGFDSVDDMLDKAGYAVPSVRPTMESVITTDELVAQMSLNERNHVYSLEASAAVIGKYIHPTDTSIKDGGKNLSYAREELMRKMANPSQTSGSGRDMVVTRYIPSVTINAVDTLFVSLQEKHRAIQAELNGIAHSLDLLIKDDELKKKNAYDKALREYNTAVSNRSLKCNEIRSAADIRRAELLREIQHLKIVIPNSLRDTYNEVAGK